MSIVSDTHEAPTAKDAAWGQLAVPPGTCTRLELGPLSLRLCNLPKEWRVYSIQHRDYLIARFETHSEPDPLAEPEGWRVVRFAQTHEEGALTIGPRLADRAIVARPAVPISLIGGDRITLYVSTPLWVALETADTGRSLAEFASFRPSDTWFGPSPRTGELCYAVRTKARITLDETAHSPVRALTRITLHNQADAPVHIERISIPMDVLQLYIDADGHFWTSPIVFERLRDDQTTAENGRLRVEATPPSEATGPVQMVGRPRRALRTNVISRALDAVLG